MAVTALRAKRVKMGVGSVSRGSIRTIIRVDQGAVAGLAEIKLAAGAAMADPSGRDEALVLGALILTFVGGLRRRPASSVRMGIRPFPIRLLALAEPPAAA